MRWPLLLAVCLVASLFSAPPVADATVIRDLRLPDLVQQSHAIVEGVVTGFDTHQPKGTGHQIYTDVSVAVTGNIKGKTADEIVIRLRGGIVGNEAMQMAGQAKFHERERVLLFLKEDAGLYFTVGMELGKWSIYEDAGTLKVRRSTTVPVARLVARAGGDQMVVGEADASFQNADLGRFVAEIQKWIR